MKAKDFKAIAYQIVTALVADECQPVRTSADFSLQSFTTLSSEEIKSLKACRVDCSMFQDGQVNVSIMIKPSDEDKAKVVEAYKRLKAKNFCLLAVEAKRDSQQKSREADELLTRAAAQLGIPVEDVEKIVVTETEG